jgi:hypothetical protein
LWEFWASIKKVNTWVLGFKSGLRMPMEGENSFKEMRTENFPNLKKDTNEQVHKVTNQIQLNHVHHKI